jgi:hypothetical protein
MPEAQTTSLIGYHGCNLENVPSIKANNFDPSQGDREYDWLGEGAYFVGEGIGNPANHAMQWAISRAWDNAMRCNKYKNFAVLKVTIRPKNPLDISQDVGKQFLDHVRNELLARAQRVPRGGYSDKILIKHLVNRLQIDVLIYDFWVMFSREKRLQARSTFPNVRMICVFYPTAIVDNDDIVEFRRGPIPN